MSESHSRVQIQTQACLQSPSDAAHDCINSGLPEPDTHRLPPFPAPHGAHTFDELKVSGNPVSSRSIGATFPTALCSRHSLCVTFW